MQDISSMQNIHFPNRYKRNPPTISLEEQDQLAQATVAVIGCGGLGGYIIEELTRLGVGHLIIIDGDSHEETNLNRQLTATEKTLGSPKVLAAQEHLALVNSNTQIEVHQEYLTSENADELLAGAQLVMDALDSVAARLELERACKKLNLPLILSAIEGWYGMLGVNFPGDDHVSLLYGGIPDNPDKIVSCPAFTPAVVASLAVAESVKVLLNKPLSLRNSWLQIDLLHMEFNQFTFPEDETD